MRRHCVEKVCDLRLRGREQLDEVVYALVNIQRLQFLQRLSSLLIRDIVGVCVPTRFSTVTLAAAVRSGRMTLDTRIPQSHTTTLHTHSDTHTHRHTFRELGTTGIG